MRQKHGITTALSSASIPDANGIDCCGCTQTHDRRQRRLEPWTLAKKRTARVRTSGRSAEVYLRARESILDEISSYQPHPWLTRRARSLSHGTEERLGDVG